MIEMDEIAAQVQRNCDISDSQYAGNYSICGLGMRLRDLYKWEKGLEPWVEDEPSLILEWIGRKEEKWERFADRELEDITIQGNSYGVFDLEKIDALLRPCGFHYGAGFVHGLKPTFLLAPLEEKRNEDGVEVLFLGRELARDLLTLPAMTQNRCILVRKESAALFLWNQIFFVKNSGRPALQFALKTYGVDGSDPASLRGNLRLISGHELETYVQHELGEIRETAFDRSTWREFLSVFPHTLAEILARTLKDILADTGRYGTIRHIVQERKGSSLGFYTAFLDGLKREMFSELPPAFDAFAGTGDWSLIEEAAAAAYQRASGRAAAVTHIFEEGKRTGDLEWARKEIEREVLSATKPQRR
jgi:hypothetical protein